MGLPALHRRRTSGIPRFALYIPPLLEALGLVELEHNARDNRVRALLPTSA